MKNFIVFFSVFFLVLSIVFYQVFWPKARLDLAAEAAGGFPYRIGLVGAVVVQCLPCPGTPPPCCMSPGQNLCVVKPVTHCTLYSEVTGTPAGGMGNSALFLNSNLAAAGITSGGQLIAGGSTMTEMDSGVLAGAGGCVGTGCIVVDDKNIFQKYVEIGKYLIASFK